jgi:hypothetical protein
MAPADDHRAASQRAIRVVSACWPRRLTRPQRRSRARACPGSQRTAPLIQAPRCVTVGDGRPSTADEEPSWLAKTKADVARKLPLPRPQKRSVRRRGTRRRVRAALARSSSARAVLTIRQWLDPRINSPLAAATVRGRAGPQKASPAAGFEAPIPTAADGTSTRLGSGSRWVLLR